MSSNDGGSSDVVPSKAKRLRKIQPCKQHGSPRLYVICTSRSTEAFFRKFRHDAIIDDLELDARRRLVGIIVGVWEFQTLPLEDFGSCFLRMRSFSRRWLAGKHVIRYLSWKVIESAWFGLPDSFEPHLQDDDCYVSIEKSGIDVQTLLPAGGDGESETFGTVLLEWQTTIGTINTETFLVHVSPELWAALETAETSYFHTVPMQAERNPLQRHILGNEVSSSLTSRWRKAQYFREAPADMEPQQEKPRWPNALNVQEILKSLDASRYISNQRQFDEAKARFAKIGDGAKYEPMDGTCCKPFWNYKSLRDARIKCDAVTCRMHREMFAMFGTDCLFIYLWVDSSPQ